VHDALQSLFPYPGGKARVAPVIWAHFGTVRHYIEPFAGSLAVLLARPDRPRAESVNDADGFVVNFFRSLVADPDTVVRYARWPVSSVDLWAYWLHMNLLRQEGLPAVGDSVSGSGCPAGARGQSFA
jgi:hypothetical protein